MIPVKAFAAKNVGAPLEPFRFERRDVGPSDVLIDILFCGICHSDIHQARDEWGGSRFPMVPGHEIVGRVARTGAKVKRFKPGDSIGVGCFVDSCHDCSYCKKSLQQFCSRTVFTYNALELDGKTPTYGGYSTQIVVDESYALRIAKGLPLERIAPLLCAGITTYSPLKHWKVKKGDKVGVVGLGGLGHMAVKLAASMGAKVTVFSRSKSKEADAKRLGAARFILSSDPNALASSDRLDFIIDTVSAPHPISSYLDLLRPEGTLALVGASPQPLEVQGFSLIMGRKTLAGSLIGGIKETQEMLNYCAKKKIFSDVEVIPASLINEAYELVLKGDVRYPNGVAPSSGNPIGKRGFRFVIDVKTL